jgi:hypothetical protein
VARRRSYGSLESAVEQTDAADEARFGWSLAADLCVIRTHQHPANRMNVVATGVYLVRPDFGALREALRCHGDKTYVRRELGSLVLIELEVRDATQVFGLGRIHQPGNQNVPYDERYFSLDREHLLASAHERVLAADFAVAFYLHAFEEAKPLQAPWGIVPLPVPQLERPHHLRDLQYRYYD